MTTNISSHFQSRIPSAIRQAQIMFSERKDKDDIQVVNLAIGNVSLPMYPAMKKRMFELGENAFDDGIINYSPSIGTTEARSAFLNIISSEGVDTSNLHCMITDGGSQAMELMMLGVCGPSSKKPLMLVEPVYTNYIEFSKRLSIPVTTVNREIDENGYFSQVSLTQLENRIIENDPGALIIIPADNPTGQFISQKELIEIAKICVKHNVWIVSDEAYRQLYYGKNKTSSIWKISEEDITGITGLRISIESASKVWNACGLRIGGLVTDNKEFHKGAVSEYTANLCANSIGQHIFGAMALESHEKLHQWYAKQREYYKSLMIFLRRKLIDKIPGLIVTHPEAAIYFVIDFRSICDDEFDSFEFVKYCASRGKVNIEGKYFTLLLAPMNGFYLDSNNGKTELRIAMVEDPTLIAKTPELLNSLYNSYKNTN